MRHDMGNTLSWKKPITEDVTDHVHDGASNRLWLDISICHIRAAKVSTALPPEQCMPSQHPESFFELITSEEAAEIVHSLSADDVEDLLQCHSEAMGGGRIELCACKTPTILPAEKRWAWVASYIDGVCQFNTLKSLYQKLQTRISELRIRRSHNAAEGAYNKYQSEKNAVKERFEEGLIEELRRRNATNRIRRAWIKYRSQMLAGNYYGQARAKAEELRKRNAANRIARWWFWLWDEDVMTAAQTLNYVNSDTGNEHIMAYVGDSADLNISADQEDFLSSLDVDFLST